MPLSVIHVPVATATLASAPLAERRLGLRRWRSHQIDCRTLVLGCRTSPSRPAHQESERTSEKPAP